MTLALALILDAILGEPKWLWDRIPHPAVLMGRLVAFLDRELNEGPNRKRRGIIAVVIMVLVASAIGNTVAGMLGADRKSTRLNSSHSQQSRMPSSA